jgi:large subunit ribosomal protein L30
MTTRKKQVQDKLRIIQVGSRIGNQERIVRVLTDGLGLGRIGSSVELPDNPYTRGMIAKVFHMVRVEELPAPPTVQQARVEVEAEAPTETPAAAPEIAEEKPAKVAKVAEEQPAKVTKVAEEQPAKVTKVAEDKPAKVTKVAEEKPAKVAKVAEEKPAKAAKVAEEKPAKAAKVAKEKSPKAAKVAKEKPAAESEKPRRASPKRATKGSEE